jgi:3',5'-nucleoside bisphosphate phosphatase
MLITSDLHGHTSFSDGRPSPEEFIEKRRAAGMLVVALSDHDVMSGVNRAAVAAARVGLWLLPAVEVTAFLHHGTPRAEQVHILAYYPQALSTPPRLHATSLFQRGLRVQEKWCAFVLDWLDARPRDDRDPIDPGGALSALRSAEFPAIQPLLDLLGARSPSGLQSFQSHNRHFWEDDPELFGWQPEEAIEAIRADGAVDIVAHPARCHDQERMRAVATYASGIELHTSRSESAPGYRELATSLRKLWTASSNDHDSLPYQPPSSHTPVRTLERLLGRVLPIELICS